MNLHRIKRWTGNGVRILLLSALTGHFVLTFLYVLPLNPLKPFVKPTLDATIGVYFRQNWNLFAPEPIASNIELHAACLRADEADQLAAGQPIKLEWRNLSGPFWERFQGNRFSAYDRLVRPTTNAVREYAFGSNDVAILQQDCRKGNNDSCELVEESSKMTREHAGGLLHRIASSYCVESGHLDSVKVALRARETQAVPWSQRAKGAPAVGERDLGVFPVDRTMAIAGVFAQEASR